MNSVSAPAPMDFAAYKAAIAAHPGYPVLVIGAPDSGSEHLVRIVRAIGPCTMLKLHEAPPSPPVQFRAVWIVLSCVYDQEKTDGIVEKIRAIQRDPAAHGVTDDTVWVTVTTDAEAMRPTLTALADYEAAARRVLDMEPDLIYRPYKEALVDVPEECVLTNFGSFASPDELEEVLSVALNESDAGITSCLLYGEGDDEVDDVNVCNRYSVVFVGDAGSGRPELEKLIADYNDFNPGYLILMDRFNYEEAIQTPSKTRYSTIFVFFECSFSQERIKETIDYILYIKEHPEIFPMYDDTDWVLVATDTCTSVPLMEVIENAKKSRPLVLEDGSEAIFKALDGALSWVPTDRKRTLAMLFFTKSMGELIDTALPVPHMHNVTIFSYKEHFIERHIQTIASSVNTHLCDSEAYYHDYNIDCYEALVHMSKK